MKFSFSILFFSTVLMPCFLLFSCVKPQSVPAIDGEAEVVLQASISTANASATAADNAATRATATAFEVGDEIGLFAVKQGVALLSSKNAINNAKLKVAAAGAADGTASGAVDGTASGSVIKGDPTALYYPNRGDKVDFYSYFPYQSGNATADALGVLVGIRTTQADFSSFKSSDLCYGSIKSVTPTNSAQKITYTHLFAQLKLNFTTYPGCPAIKSVKLLNVKDSASLNLASGALTLSDHLSTIVPQKLTSTDPKFKGEYLSIVPAQGLLGPCVEVMLTNNTTYIYNAVSKIELTAGAANDINLYLSDNGTVSLSQAPVVLPWVSILSSSSVSDLIDNDLTALWHLPHRRFKDVNEVALLIENQVTKQLKLITTEATLQAGSNDEVARYKFKIQIPVNQGFSYPYLIKRINFIDHSTAIGDTIEKCESLVAQMVNRSGSYTIGVEQDRLLKVVQGTITDWDKLTIAGGISGGGVANKFVVRMIDPQGDFVNANQLIFSIEGKRYVFDVRVLDGSNEFLAKLDTVSLPDKSGNMPEKYPYLIDRVQIMASTSSNAVVCDNECEIEVTRDGFVLLTITKNGISATTNIDGWNDESQGGTVGGGGVDNTLSVRLIEPGALYSTATQMALTIGGERYLWNINFVAGSNALLAKTINVSFADRNGKTPKSYPYVIDRVEFMDANNVVLSDKGCWVEVGRYGSVVLTVVGSNVTSAMATVSGWAPESGGGMVDYQGVTTTNPIRLIYCDGIDGRSGDVKKVILLIDNQRVALQPFSMSVSDPFRAQSVSGIDLIKQGLGSVPTHYPFDIEGVELYDVSGDLMVKSGCAVRVGGEGMVTMRVMR